MPLWLTVCLVVIAAMAVTGVVAYFINLINHR